MSSSQLALAQRRQAAARGRARIMDNRRQRRERWLVEARALWEEWREDPLFILGVALYWGEGRKCATSSRLELTNSDVNMLRVWLRWCRRFMPRVSLYYALGIHDGSDVGAALQFWKDHLGIDVNVVSVAVSSASKRKRSTLPNGTLQVRVARGALNGIRRCASGSSWHKTCRPRRGFESPWGHTPFPAFPRQVPLASEPAA